MCKLNRKRSAKISSSGSSVVWSCLFFGSSPKTNHCLNRSLSRLSTLVAKLIIAILVYGYFSIDQTTNLLVSGTPTFSLYLSNQSQPKLSSGSLSSSSRSYPTSQINSNELPILVHRRFRRQTEAIPSFINQCNQNAVKVYKNKMGKKEELDCCVGLAACQCIDNSCQQDQNRDDPACAKACTTDPKCSNLITLDKCQKLKNFPANLAMILIIVAVLIVIIVLCVILIVCYKKLRPKKDDKKKKVSFEIGNSPNVKSKVIKKGGAGHKSLKSKKSSKHSSTKLSASKQSGGGGSSGNMNNASGSRGPSASSNKDHSTSRGAGSNKDTSTSKGASTSKSKDPNSKGISASASKGTTTTAASASKGASASASKDPSSRGTSASTGNTSSNNTTTTNSHIVHTIYTKTKPTNNTTTNTSSDKSLDKNSFVSRTSRVVTPSKLSTTQAGFLPTSQQTGSSSQKVSRSVLARAVQ